MSAPNLKAFLDENGIRYVSIQHSPAFSAAEVAASAHVAEKNFAKTIVVKINDTPAMIVLPANRRLVLSDVKDLLEEPHLRLASEAELLGLFPNCEVGAMPPFGNLYGMTVYVVPQLSLRDEIAFNAGSHTEIIQMAFEDFDRLVKPRVIDLVTI